MPSFSIPVHEGHKKFSRFKFNGHIYEFNCLCFGLNCAPFIFTKLLKLVVKNKSFLSVVYLDDFLLVGKNYECTINIFQTLVLSKICTHLGFQFNSADLTISVLSVKRNQLIRMLNDFKKLNHCKNKFLSKLIKKFSSLKYLKSVL